MGCLYLASPYHTQDLLQEILIHNAFVAFLSNIHWLKASNRTVDKTPIPDMINRTLPPELIPSVKIKTNPQIATMPLTTYRRSFQYEKGFCI